MTPKNGTSAMDGKENEKMRATNLTLLTDLYELTMMQGYFKNPTDQIVVFDAFYRKNPCDGGYAISCGRDKLRTFGCN